MPDYWLVNLRDQCVEWFSDPDAVGGQYRKRGVVTGDEHMPPGSLALMLRAADLFPPR
ncbi:MAG: hypothetical protein ABR587_08985 [Candidatus Binatia bacterium]